MLNCTCNAYLSRHSSRFSQYLFCDLRGQLKLLSLFRSVLSVADLSTRSPTESNSKMRHASELTGDVKVVLNVMRIPQSVISLRRKYIKIHSRYYQLSDCLSRDEKIHHKKYLKIWVNSCSTGKSGLSLLGKSFFKPLALVDRHSNLGENVRTIVGCWKYISILKNGLKVGHLAGRIVLGSSKAIKKAISLVFALGSMLEHILKLCKLAFPRGVTITIIVSKSLFDIYKIYNKTL